MCVLHQCPSTIFKIWVKKHTLIFLQNLEISLNVLCFRSFWGVYNKRCQYLIHTHLIKCSCDLQPLELCPQILLQRHSNYVRLNDNEIGLCFFKGGVLCFRPCTWDFETFLMQDTQLILNCVTLSYIILSYLTVNNVEFQPCNETLYFCEEFDHQGALKKGLSHTP